MLLKRQLKPPNEKKGSSIQGPVNDIQIDLTELIAEPSLVNPWKHGGQQESQEISKCCLNKKQNKTKGELLKLDR